MLTAYVVSKTKKKIGFFHLKILILKPLKIVAYGIGMFT